MTQAEWLAEIGKVADELGYGISEITPGSIELHPLRPNDAATIRLETIFLSGDELRRILRPLREADR